MDIPLTRRHMGVFGTVLVAAQMFSGFQSSQNVATEIVKFKDEFQQSLLDREQFFVRKTDIQNLSAKIDQMNSQLTHINEQISSLKTFVKDNYAALGNEDIIGCSLEIDPFVRGNGSEI